jgi:hypothetical protein
MKKTVIIILGKNEKDNKLKGETYDNYSSTTN